MEFCEREELYCRSSPDVFFFADNSKFKTQSVVQLPPSALTVCLRCSGAKCHKAASGGTALCLLLMEVLMQEGLVCLLPV